MTQKTITTAAPHVMYESDYSPEVWAVLVQLDEEAKSSGLAGLRYDPFVRTHPERDHVLKPCTGDASYLKSLIYKQEELRAARDESPPVFKTI